MTTYHVAADGLDQNPGSLTAPFASISHAAVIARPGDTVLVHDGVYREWVDPQEGGISDLERITYAAALGEHPVIKGSEVVADWVKVSGSVWRTVLPNSLFGQFNPYQEKVYGDWMVEPDPVSGKPKHLGCVYLDGQAFYEADNFEQLLAPQLRTVGCNVPWTNHQEKILDPENTLYQWWAEVNTDQTVIYANFQDRDPREALVEINVRPCCFYPRQPGRNYLTVRGFEMAQAACPFTPPTADQPGMLGAHWSKGWIIEYNHLHDAKCSAISLGKDEKTGHNLFTRTRRKPGYAYQYEAVCRALNNGWNKDNIGSHVVRYNRIHDCGQNGVVGHLGCVFSQIYGNEIYRIATMHEFYGYEIAGIKLHAAIDVQIYENNIHHCTLGTWLDWEAQGTRVSRNLYFSNDRDLMVEVTHGPYIVDHNIFASDYNFENVAQGGAYIRNLCLGTMRRQAVLDRSTPYHVAHSTSLLGSSFVYSGDDRLYQNIFTGTAPVWEKQSIHGTRGYDGCPPTYEDYIAQIEANLPGDENLYVKVPQPAYINENAYFSGAEAYEQEQRCYRSLADPAAEISQDQGEVWLDLDLEPALLHFETQPLTTADLGSARSCDALYEAPDGKPITFDRDYFGSEIRQCAVGPIGGLTAGHNHLRLWPRSDRHLTD